MIRSNHITCTHFENLKIQVDRLYFDSVGDNGEILQRYARHLEKYHVGQSHLAFN